MKFSIKSIYNFLFYFKVKPSQILIIELVKLRVFYSFSVILLIAIIINYRILDQSHTILRIGMLLFFFLTLLGILLFWFSRELAISTIPLSIGIFIFIHLSTLSGGGAIGFAIFYFIAILPIIYLTFGFRVGLFLSVYFFIGSYYSLTYEWYGKESMFQNDEIRVRTLIFIVFSMFVGVISSFSINFIFKFISKIAFEDKNTGLANRFKLEEYLKQLVLQSRKKREGFSLIGIKILNLNKINAHLSTIKGDKLLIVISSRLLHSLANSYLTSKYGSSLFLSILKARTYSEIEKEIDALKELLDLSISIDENELPIQYTIAVSRFPEDASSYDQLTSNILSILDQPNRFPGEIIFFNKEDLIKEQYKFSLIEAMNRARFDEEFQILYQPKIDGLNKICIGAEALVRWNHPSLNSVSPSDFIPIAEKIGFKRKLTKWIIAKVISDYKDLENQNLNLFSNFKFAINLSILDLREKDLISFIEECLILNECSPENFEFELTESMLFDDNLQVKDNLEKLHSMKFSTAIDDFGTGYSSLSTLHQLKIDNLKIDQSFIKKIESDTSGLPVLDAIISLGQILKVQLTAEGVENEDQAKYLLSRGCNIFQGWHYSKAISISDFSKFVNKYNSRNETN